MLQSLGCEHRAQTPSLKKQLLCPYFLGKRDKDSKAEGRSDHQKPTTAKMTNLV